MAEPKVRFRKIDGSSYPEWVTIPMSDVFTEVSEKNHPEMPVLSVQQGVGTVLRDSSNRNIMYDKANLKNYKAMKKDDYIIHLRSFEGGLECSNYDGISSPAYRILRPKAILPAAYRDYFRSYEFIHNKLAVSVVGIRDGKNIDMETFWQIPITIPCPEEQQKIADFLSSVDEVISTSEEEVANLETQKKAVMKEIFSQEVRFKKADGSDFPEWEEKTFEDIFDVITDYVAAGSFADIAKNVQYIDKPDYAQLVRTVDVKNNFRNKGFVYVDKKAFDYLYRVELDKEPHIILPNIGANIGEYYLVEPCNLPYERNVLGPNAIMLGTNKNIYFWVQYLGSVCFQKNLAMIVSSTGQPKFNKTDLRKVPMMSPCEEEQRLIADFLSDFDEAIAAAKKELELWKLLKKGLLQQMFV